MRIDYEELQDILDHSGEMPVDELASLMNVERVFMRVTLARELAPKGLVVLRKGPDGTQLVSAPRNDSSNGDGEA
jgi:predicted transcriptional regulator